MIKSLSQFIANVTEWLLPPKVILQLRTAREWRRRVDSLTAELFDDLGDKPAELKRQFFKKNVHLVEIETHTKCNRICSFCPNAIVDRRHNDTLTDPTMLDRIFQELGSIDYSGQIKVARYSEPLANPKYLLERLASARALVPHAQLAIVTNTDYLTPAVLNRLRDGGLDVVYMSVYLKNDESWTLQLAHACTERLAARLGVRIVARQETSMSLWCTFEYEGLDLRSASHNWAEYGTDRGGSISQYTTLQRIGPCREPFQTLVIDYNGSAMPCCGLRSDLPEHNHLIVANLSVPGTSIFDVYMGRLSTWRRRVVRFDQKTFPCSTCRHRDIPEDLIPKVRARLKKHLQRMTRSYS